MLNHSKLSSRVKQWESLKTEVNNCFKCKLHKKDIFPIFGEGPLTTKIVFIGEAPGAMENKLKRPFVGPSGKLLNNFLNTIELARKDVFITNITKCRPPKNRDPHRDEITSCKNFLFHQIRLLRTKIVIPLGRFATRFFIDFNNMNEVVGRIIKMRNQNFYLLPMFHPATCLYHRQRYYPRFKEDFKTLKDFLLENKIIKNRLRLKSEKIKKFFQLDDFLS
ncbi:MAG: uracil-DNA glycosylase [Candidatus Hodarchaeales archaeon]|jgi:DNA polymerase